MSWRRLQIEGEKYRWTVGHHDPKLRYTDPPGELLVTLVVRGADNYKLHATFHGFALRDVWQKELVQNLTIAPALVRSVITYAREKNLTRIDHAEQIFPEAFLQKDPDQEFLMASRRQWFCADEKGECETPPSSG